LVFFPDNITSCNSATEMNCPLFQKAEHVRREQLRGSTYLPKSIIIENLRKVSYSPYCTFNPMGLLLLLLLLFAVQLLAALLLPLLAVHLLLLLLTQMLMLVMYPLLQELLLLCHPLLPNLSLWENIT
jgi:hypothetical protein